MTELMRAALRDVASSNGEGRWYRAETAGERVSLAYLVDYGLLVRRPWRGDGENRNSAFEYALPRAVFTGRVDRNGKERIGR